MPKSDWPIVMCPGCRVPMGVKKVTVDGPGHDSGEITYACEICKTETARRFNQRPPPRSA
jgi:hypothetical protein